MENRAARGCTRRLYCPRPTRSCHHELQDRPDRNSPLGEPCFRLGDRRHHVRVHCQLHENQSGCFSNKAVRMRLSQSRRSGVPLFVRLIPRGADHDAVCTSSVVPAGQGHIHQLGSSDRHKRAPVGARNCTCPRWIAHQGPSATVSLKITMFGGQGGVRRMDRRKTGDGLGCTSLRLPMSLATLELVITSDDQQRYSCRFFPGSYDQIRLSGAIKSRRGSGCI